MKHCVKCYPDSDKFRDRIRKFGLSKREFEAMFADQSGKCDICLAEMEWHTCCIDHCHKTGIVRALLCNHCNTMIGMCGEDESVLLSAIAYLRKRRDLLALLA